MSIRPSAGALLCALVLSAAGVAGAQQYTVRDFVEDPTYSAPKISPKGQYLAMSAPINGRKRLVILDIKSMKISQIATFGARTGTSGDDEVGGYWWANDDRIIFTRHTRSGLFGGSAYMCEIYAMDADGGERAQIWGGQIGAFSCGRLVDTMIDNDKYVAISASARGSGTNFAKPSIYRTDIYSGETQNIGTSPADNGTLRTDRKGKPRLAVGFNEKTFKTQLFWRHEDRIDWVDLSDMVKDDEDAWTAGFTADNQSFYLVTDDPATSTDIVYLVDPIKKVRTVVFHDPATDIMDTERDRDGRLWAVQTQPDFPTRTYIDKDHILARLTASIEPSFPDEIVEINSITDDDKTATVYVWSDRNPGDIYLLDVPTMKLSYAFSVYPKLKPKTLALREPIEYTTRDGLKIRGYLTLPPGKSKNLPLILLPHGGPHGPRDDWGFDREAQLFANHGFAVLQVNFRGSGGYGKNFERSGHKKWGREMQDDLTDATLWAVAQGYANKDRLCIYGASYGGYAALMGVAREPDLYKCAIGYVGVYDLPLMLETGNVSNSLWGQDYMKRAIGSDLADAAARSPVNHVDRIKADLFIVHGERDRQAHYENFVRLRKALDKAGKKYEWMTKPLEAHGFLDVENNVELYTRMLAFLQRNIGGADTRVAAPDNPPKKK